jgi:hypothetical protein
MEEQWAADDRRIGRDMSATPPAHLLAPFLAAADAVAREREDVDAAMAREVMGEAATLLHNGLALDGLDEHDLPVVVAGLASALVSEDPGEAVRSRAAAVREGDPDLHDPAEVRAAYLVSASVLRL